MGKDIKTDEFFERLFVSLKVSRINSSNIETEYKKLLPVLESKLAKEVQNNGDNTDYANLLRRNITNLVWFKNMNTK